MRKFCVLVGLFTIVLIGIINQIACRREPQEILPRNVIESWKNANQTNQVNNSQNQAKNQQNKNAVETKNTKTNSNVYQNNSR